MSNERYGRRRGVDEHIEENLFGGFELPAVPQVENLQEAGQ